MTLPATPPRYSSWKSMLAPIVRDEVGWRPWALAMGVKATPKRENFGVFTIGLLRAVKRWQRNHDLVADGIAGPATQQRILLLAAKEADDKAGLPGGTSYGFVVYEGGSILAATNWDVPGGVDCGPAQFRIPGPPFDSERLEEAFDPWRTLGEAASILRERRDDFLDRRPSLGKRGALRAAVLAHNWPSGADQIVRHGHLDDPDRLAGWTYNPATGHPFTRGEWSQVYPDRILKFSLGG